MVKLPFVSDLKTGEFALMISKFAYPWTIAENQYFRPYMHFHNPRAKIPDRTILMWLSQNSWKIVSRGK